MIRLYLKIPENFVRLIFRTDSGLGIYHFFVWSNLSFLHNSQWITFPTKSCLVLYILALIYCIRLLCDRSYRLYHHCYYKKVTTYFRLLLSSWSQYSKSCSGHCTLRFLPVLFVLANYHTEVVTLIPGLDTRYPIMHGRWNANGLFQ